MNFNNLTTEAKESLHKEIVSNAMSVGGKNFFIQMIENLRAYKRNPLLGSSQVFQSERVKISWSKAIYEKNLKALLNAIKREDRDGDMIEGLEGREYKETMNMMRTFKPIEFKIEPKSSEDREGFKLSILDTSESRKTKISLMFKVIFVYNIEFAKKALSYSVDGA